MTLTAGGGGGALICFRSLADQIGRWRCEALLVSHKQYVLYSRKNHYLETKADGKVKGLMLVP